MSGEHIGLAQIRRIQGIRDHAQLGSGNGPLRTLHHLHGESGGVSHQTQRAVDARAGLPAGSTSNVFRTRAALLTALAAEIARRRLATRERDQQLSLAWLELLVLARRDPEIAAAIAPTRAQMVQLLGEQRADALPLADAELAALLTGLEFAAVVVGRNVDQVVDLLERGSSA